MAVNNTQKYNVNGRITDRQGKSLKDLTVRAYDLDPNTPENFLGEAVTDPEGNYRINFTEKDFKIGGVESGGPDVFIRVLDNSQSLGESEVRFDSKTEIRIDLAIDYFEDDPNEPNYRVYGVISDSDGDFLPDVMVRAFDRDLRSEQILGEIQTDNRGFYEILYNRRQFRQVEKRSADLIIKVFAGGISLTDSPIIFNAQRETEVNLSVPDNVDFASVSLFEKIERELRPLVGKLKFAELEEDSEHQDLRFLSGETSFEKGVLARFILAHRLAAQAVQAEFWFVLLGGSFYQYADDLSLAEQLETVLDRLPTIDKSAANKALVRGFHKREISETFRESVGRWIEAFLKFAAAQTVKQSAEPTFVKAALVDAGIKDAKKQEKFARLLNEHKTLNADFIKTLEKDKSFKATEIADLRASFEIGNLTQGDFTVIKAIKDEFGVRRPEQVRGLAKKSEDEWVKLIKTKSAKGSLNLPFEKNTRTIGKIKTPEAEIYGQTLARQFRDAFPTIAFAGGLERAMRNGGSRGLRHAEAFSRFLERHENFELLNTPVEEFFKNNVERDFRAQAANEDFKSEVKAVQRVFKLAPTFAATDALLADDVHSAQQVYRIGESEFVRRYAGNDGFTEESARITWNRAADTHAAVVTLVGDLKAFEGESLPKALNFDSESLEAFPNWNNLFQAGDLCECEHCNSVLGPAAYFADLLMFLKDRRSKNPGESCKDILFDRRPDLGFLELNCENALTPIPYVDVVCEILEDVIADGANDVALNGFNAMPANPATAKTAVAAALSNAGIALGDDFSLSQVKASDPNRWVAHGDDVTYLLKKKAAPHFFAEILRNTKTGADELRAYPQYVNPQAYLKLRQAKYPLTLPFDLFAEEVRAAFQKTNLQRWDLMTTLRDTLAPNNPTDGEIAAEYFNISADPLAAFDEKRLILQADTSVAGQHAVWGETGITWLAQVGNVKNFLQKTGLEYNDVLTLLDLKFINPDGDILIQHLDATCDTAQKVIQPLNATKLDRIHRFLRLWRKLSGWKMWELDFVLRHPQIGAVSNPDGALDDPFLVNLFYFSRLQKRLGKKATVEQTAALFGDINTKTNFKELYEKRENALYQNLFLNKRLINPPDTAFEIDSVTGDLPTGETLTDHHPTIIAALGVRETDLNTLKMLTKASDGTAYIDDDLNLANLSFLFRHSWLPKLLKLKTDEWKILLKLYAQDIAAFATPKSALEFIEDIDRLKTAGFGFDELNWLLAADRTAKAALKEADAARFLTTLRKDLQAIKSENDPAQYDFLNVLPPTDDENLTILLETLLQKLGRDETAVTFFIETLRDEVKVETEVLGLPGGFDFPVAIKDAIRVAYDEPAKRLRFTGLMTSAEKTMLLTDASLAAVTGIPAYQNAVEDLFTQPRLALKFYEQQFAASLSALPEAVDFNALGDALRLKIFYDTESRELQFKGILSKTEKTALDALSADVDYRNAVNSLFTQPVTIMPPNENIWLLDADLALPLRDLVTPANDNLAENLVKAAKLALAYLSKTQSENAIVQQTSAQLGLTESLTRRLLTGYDIFAPDTLLEHLANNFAATFGVVDYATLKNTFDGWFWANRVAAIWKKWKIALPELERIIKLTAGAQLLDFKTLPLDDTQTIASLERFLRTNRLIRLRDSLPETSITLLEVLEKLSDGDYAAVSDFAEDVELIDETWLATEVESLVNSLDLNYPADYLLAENWERMRRAFYFLENLNASVETVKTFAATAMTETHAKVIKELLRSKFGSENWLSLSTEIQDVLRERKRDALTAYLLTQPKPADAPSGKWENTNDLYAYYLLDVEMCSCMLTSRLVQASGSVQLFVQRAFMGLEPQIVVNDGGVDGDSAWRWWTWMRKYRVWEANRKVFLYPENWIEPELKKDRSSFFKDMENDLMQNEINQYTVETAFQTYLEKLDGVAQLEIAGFYQEDDGDNAIVHVFGRTKGAEPHLYYYRTYDYRQWTPWEKVDVDIQGDYLIPVVINKRLFIFFPVFTEVPDEEGNSNVTLPDMRMGEGSQQKKVDKTRRRLRMQMAVSDYRNGKWSPKKISKDYAESAIYQIEIAKKHYSFYPVDRSEIDGRFGIKYYGTSLGVDGETETAFLSGAFEIANCKGVPEKTNTLPGNFFHIVRPEWESTGDDTVYLKWQELGTPPTARHDLPENDFTLESNLSSNWLTPILMETPWLFKVSPPWHLSYMDRLFQNGIQAFGQQFGAIFERGMPFGSWLPFFYNDKKRTFFVLPVIKGFERDTRPGLTNNLGSGSDDVTLYYPDIKRLIRQIEDLIAGAIRDWLDSLDLSAVPPGDRQQFEEFLWQNFPEEFPPPYTDDQFKELMLRYMMRFFHYYMGVISMQVFQFRRFHFKNYYHPFVCDFAKMVFNPLQGIPAMMSRDTQLKNSGFSFQQNYQPTLWVIEPTNEKYYPEEIVDFSPDGAYSSYNWELFFHAPLLIANSLSKNQRFEEARDWYHYIFNPIGVESPVAGGSVTSKYWITKPFFETTDSQYVQQRIDNIMRMLPGDTTVPDFSAQARKDLEDQVYDWRTNPFEPHRIANYRTVAYQKTVVMKYLDNLIAWGDNLFRQDSMESINEATQLYILAAEILGPRPRKVPPRAKPPVESFNELENELDKFSNALIEVENLVPPLSGDGTDGSSSAPLPLLYFCIPQNEKMLEYWDIIADRLYKIRNCMNIEGVVRQLSLFEPPIDPAALVKAVAGGMDLSSALSDLNAPLPLYRFSTLLQKANEVCNDVKSLGGALLSALEKKDAEALSRMRQDQEIKLLEAVKSLRELQISEAKENLDGIKKSKELAEIKKKFYESRDFMNAGEIVAVTLNGVSTLLDIPVSIGYITGGVLKAIPNFVIGASGFGGSPVGSGETGGSPFGDAAKFAAEGLAHIARNLDKMASISSTIAGYQRRKDDWDFQKDLAIKEIEQINESIAAAEYRISIAEKELENHNLQIENAKAVDEFMRSKYTNQELYQWHIGQISGIYFQSYKLAYDLAKRAERCFRFELGLQNSSYINFGYWDSLKKGLLSGEKLQYDLRRLETAYIEQNRREFELTKHIPLAQLDPLAIIELRETGRCFLNLPEEIFDLDYPGHYFRRIKSVSLTIPCIAGPYTTISCTLRLLKNSIRTKTTNGDNGYARNTDDQGVPADDERFIENNIPVRAVAISNAQNDSGVFELSFRDERYLPFEGAGAVSQWSLELFSDSPTNNPDPNNPDFGRPLRQFDYNSITDAIVHVKYTAREDVGKFKNGVITHLRDYFEKDDGVPSLRLFNLRQEFPTEWHHFLNPPNPATGNVFELNVNHDLFPFRDKGKTLKVNAVWLLARCRDTNNYTVVMTPPLPTLPPANANVFTLAPKKQYGGLHFDQKDVVAFDVEIAPDDSPVNWKLKMGRAGGGNLQVDDLLMVLGYEWK